MSISVASHVGCCGTVQRVGFDAFGRVASLGIRDRVFTHVQRKTISLRDGRCVLPGCGGGGDVLRDTPRRGARAWRHNALRDNGVLLCWFHHRTLGSSGWDVAVLDGVPHARGPGWW